MESVENNHTNIFQLTIRVVFLLLAVAVDLGVLYISVYPGSTKDESFARFVTGSILLWVSLILSAAVFPYVVWKLVKRERPTFWGIALAIAALPMLVMLAVVILGS
jgi:hypothetical protein